MIKEMLINFALSKKPDLIIGGAENPYLYRWFLIPRNRFFNVYIHYFMRSDDDRALHDHPWINCSVLLEGLYAEHRIDQGGINKLIIRRAGDWCMRFTGKLAHRIELINGPCWTLFMTGPRYREWGFHCADHGWVHWKDFTNENDPGDVGKGCDQ